MSRKHAFFLAGLASVFVSPFFFDPLSQLIQNHGPAWATVKVTRVHHLTFWALSAVWAVYFGLWVWKSEWRWFSSENSKSKLVLILTIATLIRVFIVVFADTPPIPNSDEIQYDRMALKLIETGHLDDGGQEPAYRPVGYVTFLVILYSVFGHSLFLAKLFNAFFDLGLLLLLWKIFILWSNEAVALKAVTVVAFYPPIIYSNQDLLSEHFFSVLWMSSIYFWEIGKKRIPASFLSGAIFGLATLVRPVLLAWTIVPIIITVLRKRWISFLGFFLAAILITAPWFYRNHQKFGIWALSTHAGLNFWMGANPKATSHATLPDSLPFDFSNRGKMERTAWKLGLDYVIKHPLNYLYLGMSREVVIFGFDYTTILRGLTEKPPYVELLFGIFGEAFWWILIFFFWVKMGGILINTQKRRMLVVSLPFLTLLLWAAVHFFFVGSDRFHHPVVPFFAFLALMPLGPKADEK